MLNSDVAELSTKNISIITDESAECNLRIVVEEVMDRIYQFTKNKAPPEMGKNERERRSFQFTHVQE